MASPGLPLPPVARKPATEDNSGPSEIVTDFRIGMAAD